MQVKEKKYARKKPIYYLFMHSSDHWVCDWMNRGGAVISDGEAGAHLHSSDDKTSHPMNKGNYS